MSRSSTSLLRCLTPPANGSMKPVSYSQTAPSFDYVGQSRFTTEHSGTILTGQKRRIAVSRSRTTQQLDFGPTLSLLFRTCWRLRPLQGLLGRTTSGTRPLGAERSGVQHEQHTRVRVHIRRLATCRRMRLD